MRESARRLFLLPPGELYEHPPGLPVSAGEIPEGPIVGFDCYAPSWRGDPRCVVGPFTAVIVRPYTDGRLCIVVGGKDADDDHASRYWYGSEDTASTLRPPRPCWYQSGCTLRFVRSRPPTTPPTELTTTPTSGDR